MNKVLVSLFIIFAVITTTTAQTDPTTLLKVGDKAPAFSCKTIDGNTIDISKLNGKIVMINFFATWCGPCKMELPLLQKNIWDKYKDNRDFVLIILGREHNESEVRSFVESNKYTMPFAPDPNRLVYKLYATQFIPRNIIIGKDGRIIFQNIGYNKEEFKKLETLLAEKLK
ncbi:MAG: TlpA family protein disulfide reductase [Bacteroidales bacterium]|nr:TlpA family protein disulfide reductase [Bacteroidales bacterium]